MRKESGGELKGLVRFFHTAGKLKEVKRQGWVERGVQQGESVAEHSFRLALLAMVFAERKGLDVCKAVKLALVHDLPEAVCGDVASRVKEEMEAVSNGEKKAREEKALGELVKGLSEGLAGEIKELWLEFEEGKSAEAVLVRELDRLEAIFQAQEYEKKGNFKVALQEFYDYADARVKDRELRAVFGILMQERPGRE